MTFRLSAAAIDSASLRKELGDTRAGACVIFEGWVRASNDGREVRALEYEAYAPLAEKEGARILAEAKARFAILDALCVHRTGPLALGELAVWVGVTAEHRGIAFEACRHLIDELKARLPVWKKEHYAQGPTAWINAQTQPSISPRNQPVIH